MRRTRQVPRSSDSRGHGFTLLDYDGDGVLGSGGIVH